MSESGATPRFARRVALATIATAAITVGASAAAAASSIAHGTAEAMTIHPQTSVQPMGHNWQSYISDWSIDTESHRWKDNHYTQIHFRNCSLQSRGSKYWKSFDIQLKEDKSLAPDKKFGVHRGKACFHGGVTTMHWNHDNDRSGDNRYFKLAGIDGTSVGTYQRFNAGYVFVDTTKKDKN